jgi:hypothetical protein
MDADPQLEADAMLRAHEGKLGPCLSTTAAQFAVLHGRSQLLLTLCTLTLTITGFSGPKIIASGELSRWALVVGIALVLIGLVMLLLSSLVVHFATQFIVNDEPRIGLSKLILYRNRKMRWYRWQLACIVFGLTSYVIAVIHFLLVGSG